MKFSPKCRTKKLGMIYTILGSFCSFINWEGADIRPQISPRKIPAEFTMLVSESPVSEKLGIKMSCFGLNFISLYKYTIAKLQTLKETKSATIDIFRKKKFFLNPL